jgi:dienelactone hydrolase
MKVLTNSHIGVPYGAKAGDPRILIYCHGLISFASENTMLMEYLASQAFVVISIQHLDQLTEFKALQASLSKDVKDEQSRIMREIRSSSRDRRSELWGKYFRIASSTNRIVSARSADVGFVISEMQAVLSGIPALDESAGTRILGVIGLSLGGAVATEFSKTQGNHLRCVVNMDGGHYGELQDEPVRIRYLMVYSEENEGINDSALNAVSGVDIRTSALAETKHLNFHDIAGIYPVMKWMRVIGRADPLDVLRRRNEMVHEFASAADA